MDESMMIDIDPTLRKEAEELLKSMGLDMSTAINLFLFQCVLRGGIPFNMNTTPVINNETVAMMIEAMKNPNNPSVIGYTMINPNKKVPNDK